MQKLVWGWPAVVLTSSCLVGLASLLLLVRPEALDARAAVSAGSVAVQSFVLLAAAAIYLHWRMSENTLAGWLTLALVTMGVPNLAIGVLLVVDPHAAEHRPGWPLFVQIVVAGTLLGVTLVAGQVSLRVDPLAAGLCAGLVFGGLDLALVRWAPVVVLPSMATVVLSLATPVLALFIVEVLVRGAEMPRGAPARLLIGVALVAAGQVALLVWRPTDSGIVHLVLCGVGTTLLCYTAVEMVRTSIRNQRRELKQVYLRLLAAEAADREHRARLHEIGSTVAGITSVSRLIHEPTVGLPPHRRSLLQHTMAAELSRLERLMGAEADSEHSFDVDDVLGQLVVAQHAQGHLVSWEPSGLTAYGRPDDLAEAVHVLLDNAARHGSGCGATLGVEAKRGMVQISVSDNGPGIPSELRPRVFDWGAGNADAGGQGIGLTIARELVERQGGYLFLDESPHLGARFIIGVRVGEAHDEDEHRAG